MVAKLVAISTGDDGRSEVFNLDRPRVTIGRSPQNDIVIPDPEVSKFHAELVSTGESFELTDNGSSNGTYVNERAIRSAVLVDGDVLEFGRARFEFVRRETEARPEVAIVSEVTHKPTQVLVTAALDEMMTGGDVDELEVMRNLYSRVRTALKAVQGLIETTDVRKLCESILDVAFRLVGADTGVVLLFDAGKKLKPWATKSQGDAADIVISRTIIDQAVRERAAVLASDALTDDRFSTAQSVVASGMRSLVCVPLVNGNKIYGLLYVCNYTSSKFGVNELELLTAVATGAGMALSNALLARQLADEARMRESLGRFLSPVLVEQVIEKRIDMQRGGDELEATVMFADIRGFTALTERSRARDVVTLLNEYFDQMVEIVFRYDGILDKFIGDAIMAVWGPPTPDLSDGAKALEAARDMQLGLDKLNKQRVERGEEPIHIGIGLASGKCVAGTIGARRRMEYTVIGDAVNLASRLAGMAKAGEVLCDRATFCRADMPDTFIALPPAEVRGKQDKVAVYRVWSRDHSDNL